jgi:hypothetical protein
MAIALMYRVEVQRISTPAILDAKWYVPTLLDMESTDQEGVLFWSMGYLSWQSGTPWDM